MRNKIQHSRGKKKRSHIESEAKVENIQICTENLYKLAYFIVAFRLITTGIIQNTYIYFR